METCASDKTFCISGNATDSPCAEQEDYQEYQTADIKTD